MRSKYSNWKSGALVGGLILLSMFVYYAGKYYQIRFINVSPLIPENITFQISRPYLVAAIVSIAAAIVAWTFYFLSKYKICVAACILAFVFNELYFAFGDYWGF